MKRWRIPNRNGYTTSIWMFPILPNFIIVAPAFVEHRHTDTATWYKQTNKRTRKKNSETFHKIKLNLLLRFFVPVPVRRCIRWHPIPNYRDEFVGKKSNLHYSFHIFKVHGVLVKHNKHIQYSYTNTTTTYTYIDEMISDARTSRGPYTILQQWPGTRHMIEHNTTWFRCTKSTSI